MKTSQQSEYWWRVKGRSEQVCAIRPKIGQLCSQCKQGHLAYDSLFRMVCPKCSYAVVGGGYT